MTTKDKDEQKELQTYLSEWQKRHEEYLEKKSQETSDQEERVHDKEDRQEPMPSDVTVKSDDEDESKTENEELDELEELDIDQAEKSEVAEEGDESTLGQKEDSKPEKKQIEKIHLYRALPILIVSSLLALSSLYFITPLSTIKNIVVSGNERVSQEEVIKNTQIDNRDYTSTTFLNRSKHAKKLTQANPWIEKAEILYQFPTTFTIKIKEYKNSFHALINVYIAVATIPGPTRGNTILTKVTSLFAPSTLAASSIPIGTVLKNPTSIHTA